MESLHLIIGFSRIIQRKPEAKLTPELAKEINKHSYQLLKFMESQQKAHIGR